MLLEAVLAIPREGVEGGRIKEKEGNAKGREMRSLTMDDKKVYCACKGYRSLMTRKEVDLREL